MTTPTTDAAPEGSLRVDIVSDVVCPWCVVGYRQLKQAAEQAGQELDIHWHPFELNPQMEPEGENLREHIMGKYGSSEEQSQAARAQLTQIGAELGFTFAFTDDSRIYNTFQAHQLLGWAETEGRGHDLKQALFQAYFTDGKDVSDPEVLIEVITGLGLDTSKAQELLDSAALADQTRSREQFWMQQGVQGVPAMVFKERHLVTGAQGVGTYVQILKQLAAQD